MSFNTEPHKECVIIFTSNGGKWNCESCGAESSEPYVTTTGLRDAYYRHLAQSHKLALTDAKSAS